MRRACLCLFGLILVVFLLLAGADRASASVYSVNSTVDDLHFEKVKGYDRVIMAGARSLGNPGDPLLPVRFLQVAIPSEVEAVGVQVLSFKRQELSGTFKIYPAQLPMPVSMIPA
jgi:hypothetical protein